MKRELPKSEPYLSAEEIETLLGDFEAILRSKTLTRGPFLDRFERDFAASANAVLLAGGTPVLADITRETLTSDLTAFERHLSSNTRGIIVVHISGFIQPDLHEVRRFCDQRELFLLEDAAHAHGASLDGKPAGSLGHAGSFSFFPTKPMTSGEGGMLTTDDPDLAKFAASFRCHGIADEGTRLERLGANYRLPELSAALGVRQLERFKGNMKYRNTLVDRYISLLFSVCELSVFCQAENQVYSYYKFPTVVPDRWDRDQCLSLLERDFGIRCGTIYWPPCHLEPFYRQHFGYGEGSFPIAEEILPRTLTLPLYNGMALEDVDYVCAAVKQVAARCEGR
jgi:perosamine synthetase